MAGEEGGELELEPEGASSHRYRPYPCTFCTKRYKTEVKLLLHFQRRHVTPETLELLDEPEPEENDEEKKFTTAGSTFEDDPLQMNEEEEEQDPVKNDILSSMDDEQTCAQLLCSAPFLFRNDPRNIPKSKTPAELEAEETARRKRRPRPYQRKYQWSADEFHHCIFCKKVFKPDQQALFHYHLNTHTKEQPYFCEYCDETFGRPNYLTKHARMHVGANRFPCPLCNAGFTELSYMKTHVRMVHAQQKAFKCQECHEGFYDQNKLDRHMLRHTKERNFPCTKCDKRFARADTLKKHMLKLHKEKRIFKCTICMEQFLTWKALVMHSDLEHDLRERVVKQQKKFKILFVDADQIIA